mmetsp:Transcript_89894/g.284560  ORF Transcript_89894/g.284560 Transcript_89894/m.284560 type:complete len:231 (+) Transcript_89894:620-1312(+)
MVPPHQVHKALGPCGPVLRRNLDDHAKVQEAQVVALCHEHVPGVGVRVDHAQVKDHGRIRLHADAYVLVLDAPGLLAHADSMHPLGGEHPHGGELLADPRDDQAVHAGEGAVHPLHEVRLPGIVQLLPQSPRPCPDNLYGVHARRADPAHNPPRDKGQSPQDHEVHRKRFGQAWPLHLHGILPLAPGNAVDLAEAGGSHRGALQSRCQCAELLREKAPGVTAREGGHLIA